MLHILWIKIMKLFCLKNLSVFLLLGLSYACYADPVLTIKPMTSIDIGIPKQEHRTVRYKVQNTSTKTYTFELEHIPGTLVLIEKPNNCQIKTTLVSGQSCVLNLQLSALNLTHQGPKFCSKDLKQCIEPELNEKISVMALPEATPTIDITMGLMKPNLQFSKIKGSSCKSFYKKKTLNQINNDHYTDYYDACSLEIFAGVDYYTGIGLVNTSTIPIYIHTPSPLNPYLDTTFDSSCTNYNQANPLQPGDFCAFAYKAPANTSAPLSYDYFLVYPVFDNTHYIAIIYSTQVFKIGDYYPDDTGEQIFQLPTEEEPGSGLYIMDTVANNDNPAASQYDAFEYCLDKLPSINLLTTLQNLSTCGGTGVITGFNCNQTYWSDDHSKARNFQSSTNIDTPAVNQYPSRCINSYYFYLKY
jgi:hypothetical protein